MNKEFKRSIKGQDVYSESGAEYVLPDYCSDVRKILFSEARVRPAGKFSGNDEVEFTGIVVYNVMYSDTDGRIGGVSFSSDYDFTVKSPSESFESIMADTRVANFALRLIGPRKLSAKCYLSSAVSTTERLDYTPTGVTFEDDGTIEKQTEFLNMRNTRVSESIEREYAEQLCRLDGAIEDEVRVVYSRAEVIPESVVIEGDSAVVRGELVMLAVVENGDEPAYLVEKRKKIEESIPLEDPSADANLTPEVIVTSERTSIRADEDGCEIVMDVIADFAVKSDMNLTAEVISDAFSTCCSVENSYHDIEFTELVSTLSSKEKHTAEIKRADLTEGNVREVVFLSAEPKIEEVKLEDGRITVRAEIRYTGVASEMNDDGSISYSALKYSSPFEQNVNINCQINDKTHAEAKCTVVNAEANVDANNIYLTSLIETRAVITENKKQSALFDCSLNSDSPFDKNESVVTVYYPDEGETLFSVAKKFHVSLDRLCENNSVPTSSTMQGTENAPQKLMIY